MSELAPGFLIAVPQMDDPNFARSVVLLIEHSESGAMGIICNQQSEIALAEIAREHGAAVHAGSGRAFIGGPVQRERGFLIHRRRDVQDSVEVQEGIYLSVSTDSLRELLAGDPSAYRLCLGYAGWGAGQIERELVAGGWLSSKVVPARLFDTPHDQIWDAVIRDLGIDPAYLVMGGGKQ